MSAFDRFHVLPWAELTGRGRFYGVADVYSAVADDSLLGEEKPGKRVRGKTVEDVVDVLAEGLRSKKRKMGSS